MSWLLSASSRPRCRSWRISRWMDGGQGADHPAGRV